MLKKLKKIYRIFFLLELTDKDVFDNRLKANPIVNSFKLESKNCYVVKFQNGQEFFVRNQDHSDYNVFMQIFNFEEYKTVLSLLKLNIDDIDDTVLIDCGANVGYVTAYFSKKYHFTKIFCIEPSSSNIEILNKNINKLKNSKNIQILQKAISGNENMNFDLGFNFRDRLDWSITTSANEKGNVKGITINEIVNNNNLKSITLLKIDIEGAERFVFDRDVDLSFLKITKIIAIEIHDEFNIRESIYSILKEYDFYLFESGELTIGLNTNYLKSEY